MTQPMPPLADYARSIIARMDERRGSVRPVSSRDWQHLTEWHGQGVPLYIVLEAMDVCFASLTAAQKRTSRIALPYVATAVAELWRERAGLYVGAAEVVE